MKRFAAMQLCPLLWQRAVVATAAARAKSAEGMTTKGSLPPSSSTVFLISRLAISATDRPACSLPVNVPAATLGSVSIFSMAPEPTSRVWKTSCGKPASRNTFCSRNAACGTLDACFSRPTLPAMRAGAAKRTTCHNGKFHGMIASTGPSGCQWV
jgi:hypothetical protein